MSNPTITQNLTRGVLFYVIRDKERNTVAPFINYTKVGDLLPRNAVVVAMSASDGDERTVALFEDTIDGLSFDAAADKHLSGCHYGSSSNERFAHVLFELAACVAGQSDADRDRNRRSDWGLSFQHRQVGLDGSLGGYAAARSTL